MMILRIPTLTTTLSIQPLKDKMHNDVQNNESQIRIMTHIIMTLSMQPLKDTMDTSLSIMAIRIMKIRITALIIMTFGIQTPKGTIALCIATQHNDAQYHDTQNNNTYNDTQHSNIQVYYGAAHSYTA
jgi:hypothetical protein